MADSSNNLDIGFSFTPNKEQSEVNTKKGIQDVQEVANKNPVNVPFKLNTREIGSTVKDLTTGLKNNLEGLVNSSEKIEEQFRLIKMETKQMDSGKWAGMTRVVETFANGVNETQTRVTYFKENMEDLENRFEVVDSAVTKSVVHLENYQQAMELTAKKLKNLNKETREYYNSAGGKVTETYTENASGQKFRTTIIEQEKELGKVIQSTSKDILNEKGEWEKYEGTITEVIDKQSILAQSLKGVNNQLEAQHTFLTTDDKGTQYKNTWKTIQDQSGNFFRTEIKEWQGQLGQTIQEVTFKLKQQDGTWKIIGNTSRKVLLDQVKQAKEAKAEQEKLNKTIIDKTTIDNKYSKIIDGVSHSIQQQQIEEKTLNGTIKSSSVITDEYKDSLGRLVKTITKVDSEGKKTTETMITMGKQARHLGQSFSDIIVKVAKFYVASLPIRAVQTAITNTIQAVKDFDSALTEFKKVSDLSGKSLDEYCKKLEILGELTGRTRTEMVQMATEFKRSGYDDNEAANLAQIASLYQNIADEELSASEASSVLISQMKAFSNQGIEAIDVINGINEVANRNAVSSGDIGRGLTQAGAALSTYGNTFYETIGLKIRSIKTDLTAGNP